MFFIKKKNIPPFSWLLLVTILLCLPGKTLPDTGGDWFSRIYADKWIHIFLFAVLVFLFCKIIPLNNTSRKFVNMPFLLTVMAGILYGTLMELVQLWMVSGRGFESFDILADAGGCLLGAIVFRYRQKKLR